MATTCAGTSSGSWRSRRWPRRPSATAAVSSGTIRSTSTRSAPTCSTCSISWPTCGERAPAAFDRVQYIEQPTHRDLRAHPENRMHEAAKIKPVVIDESLIDLESLQLARELGYSGVALKACKGHSEALLMGGRGAEIRHVPLRAGPDLPGRFVLALGQPGGPHSHGGGRSKATPGNIARPAIRLGRALSRHVQHHRRHARHGQRSMARAWAIDAGIAEQDPARAHGPLSVGFFESRASFSHAAPLPRSAPLSPAVCTLCRICRRTCSFSRSPAANTTALAPSPI